MEKKNHLLYDYLINQSAELTKAWQSLKHRSNESIQVLELPEMEKYYESEGSPYLSVIAEAVIGGTTHNRNRIKQWAITAAANRATLPLPLCDSLNRVGMFRNMIWQMIKQFVNETELEITVADIFRWESQINETIDYLSETFTKYYMNALVERLTHQAELIHELSSPLIKITDSVALLPLIGEFDLTRADYMTESVLRQSADFQLSTLIIDCSGIHSVDVEVSSRLFQMVKGLSIVGVETVLTGIRPEFARTSVNLGIDFSHIKTKTTLMKAIEDFQITK